MLSFLLLAALYLSGCTAQYEPTWESIETRPIPEWFPALKFGIFIHWGVYSVPAYGCPAGANAAEWYELYWQNHVACNREFHDRVYGPDFPYSGFGPLFEAELYDPAQWADIFSRAGAQYIVITSKHHDGYALWGSPEARWNSVEIGPHRDLIGDLWSAMKDRAPHMRLGLYHSLLEWTHPLYVAERANNGTTRRYPEEHLIPMLKDLVTKYVPDIVWTDGEWEMPYTYWGSLDFLSWLYNEGPNKEDVVVNDRWDLSRDTCDKSCIHTVESTAGGFDPNHIWEECRTMSNPLSWGYNRNLNVDNYESSKQMIHHLIRTVAYNGNLLLNVGPTGDGRIPEIQEERLNDIGAWLEINGEAIFETRYWTFPNEPSVDVFYTESETDASTIYALTTVWPDETLLLSRVIPSSDTEVFLLGSDVTVEWKYDDDAGVLVIAEPPLNTNQLPDPNAWVFKITNIDEERVSRLSQ